MKYIFVTGGVVSGLGKGITAAALGRLLKCRGLRVTLQKFDPYLNVDPGTMNPYQHGEVFVTDDGHECDLDLGHYERFIDETLSKNSNISQGQIYKSILEKEREGRFLGGCVQVIPHVTDEIKDKIRLAGRGADIVIAEIGGTVGDIESQPFIEAIRQVAADEGRENVLYIHVSLMVTASGELKSKPTQHSVKTLLSMGIQPDVIVCRSEEPISDELKQKLALFCNVSADGVIPNYTADTLYEVPLLLRDEGLDTVVCRRLGLRTPPPDTGEWERMVQSVKSADKRVKIALAGKYVALKDAYLSVAESLRHAGAYLGAEVDIDWINSEDITGDNAGELLRDADGLLVPGGFGSRGIEGKISAVRYAREHNLPFMGICLGLHMAVIDFARRVVGWDDANSAEFDKNGRHRVIDLLPEQRDISDKGGTMRLGQYSCRLQPGTLAARLYGAETVSERHRHRYEVNGEYLEEMKAAGLVVSGISPDGRLAEIIELKDHPFFIATQFHPEFKSRPGKPHPIFRGLVEAALKA